MTRVKGDRNQRVNVDNVPDYCTTTREQWLRDRDAAEAVHIVARTPHGGGLDGAA